MTLQEILITLRAMAPEDTAMPGDPVGLLIGSESNRPVHKVGVCLDATPEACERAVALQTELVICHHPLIYQPLKTLNPDTDPIARAALTLAKADIALYAMHTNWDKASGGVNDCLADLLGLTDIQPLGTGAMAGLARIGSLPTPRPLADFVRMIEQTLNCTGTNSLRHLEQNPRRMIARIAVCGGQGGSLLRDAHAASADAFVTADIRHHEFLEAHALGIALLDAGHDATETPSLRDLCQTLSKTLAGVETLWVGT